MVKSHKCMDILFVGVKSRAYCINADSFSEVSETFSFMRSILGLLFSQTLITDGKLYLLKNNNSFIWTTWKMSDPEERHIPKAAQMRL